MVVEVSRMRATRWAGVVMEVELELSLWIGVLVRREMDWAAWRRRVGVS